MNTPENAHNAPKTRLDQVGLDLVSQGYNIVPTCKGQKYPYDKGWQDGGFDQSTIEALIDQGRGDDGVGIICGSVVGFDIDVSHREVVDKMASLLVTNRTCRIGRSPRALYVLRSVSELTWRNSITYLDRDGNKQAIELRAKGQQFVAHGDHPDTKKPYFWPQGDLTNLPVDDLPLFTEELWEEACALLDKEAERLGWTLMTEASDIKKEKTSTKEKKSTLETAKPPLALSQEYIDEVLHALSVDVDERPIWIEVGAALHHQFGGIKDGLDLWDTWSGPGLTYKPGECKRIWSGFGANGKHPITFASLIKRVNDRALLEQIALEAANDNDTQLFRPFEVRKAEDIPRRDWLLGTTIQRGVVSATVAPGGAGKSILTLAEAISLASDGNSKRYDHPPGIGLLGQQQAPGLRIGYLGMEDTPDEQELRARGIIDHYQVDDAHLSERLFRLEADVGFKIATTVRGDIVDCSGVGRLKESIVKFKLDLVIIDPFVSAHSVPENDNGAIDHIVKTLGKVAKLTNCAIHLVHHASKSGDRALGLDSARGASSFRDGMRSLRMLSNMTLEECKKFGLDAKERYRFKKIHSVKGNNSPGGGDLWFEMISHDLGQGDSVGVPVPWTPPTCAPPSLNDEEYKTVMDIFLKDGPHWKHSAANEWVGHAIAKALGIDVSDNIEKKRVERLLEELCQQGVLEEYRPRDAARGKDRPALRLNKQGFEPIPPPGGVGLE